MDKNKDKKKKLGAEPLEKREAPFMPISYQEGSGEESGTGGQGDREFGSRQVGGDREPQGGAAERPIFDKPQR